MPYKHYESGVIEGVIAASENGVNVETSGGCAADASTMRRWIKQFKERGALAVGKLISLLLDLYDRHISLLKLQNRTLLKQLSRLLCEISKLKPKNGNIIGKANFILTTKNCGFL
jgi:transposase-like protein